MNFQEIIVYTNYIPLERKYIYGLVSQDIKNIFSKIIISNYKYNIDKWIKYYIFPEHPEIYNILKDKNLEKKNMITIFKLLGTIIDTRKNNCKNDVPQITINVHKAYHNKCIDLNPSCILVNYILKEIFNNQNTKKYFNYDYSKYLIPNEQIEKVTVSTSKLIDKTRNKDFENKVELNNKNRIKNLSDNLYSVKLYSIFYELFKDNKVLLQKLLSEINISEIESQDCIQIKKNNLEKKKTYYNVLTNSG